MSRRLYDGTTPIEVPEDPEYHLTVDLADKAIAWIRQQRALLPDKPFFVYWAPAEGARRDPAARGLQTYVKEEPVPPATHQVRMEFAYDSGGLAKRRHRFSRYYDGEKAGEGRVYRTQPFFSADERWRSLSR